MTGYGEGIASKSGIIIQTEITSVNKKQLDIQLSLPKNLICFESDIQNQIKKMVSRGRINCSVKIISSSRPLVEVEINRPLLSSYEDAINEIAGKNNPKNDISLSTIITQPDIIQLKPVLSDNNLLNEILHKSLAKAISSLIKMKKKEGEELKFDICKRIEKLSNLVEIIDKRSPIVKKNYKKKLTSRLKSEGFEKLMNDERVLKEVALYGERSDITEEIVRIISHLKQMNSHLESKKSVGRALDFLCQELFREINTICSKADDLKIIKSAVTFKIELEKIREQSQNVE
tara:strand:+ start:2291 stop:3157 length:867 start_codon:yes stop_codon:yes gene_type:complete